MTNKASLNIIESIFLHQNKKDKGFYFFDQKLQIKEFCSYPDLISRAIYIKENLEKQNIKPGSKVLLVYDQGIEFVAALIGCFMAKVIAVPCYPPYSKAMIWRFINVIKSIQPTVLLVDSVTYKIIKLTKILEVSFFKKLTNWILRKKNWDTLDEVSFSFKVIKTEGEKKQNSLLDDSIIPAPEDIAFLQYTSGSVSQPKGVIIKHRNLNCNLEAMKTLFAVNEDSTIFSWLPQYHDMGLIGCILTAISVGCNIYFTSPLNFVKSPMLWLKGMSLFKATHSAGPNFAYDMCVNKVTEDDFKSLDLKYLKSIINGAEPIKPQTLNSFNEKFSKVNFKANSQACCYGLAEATLLVTVNQGNDSYYSYFDKELLKENIAQLTDEQNGVALVNCGPVIPFHSITIRHPETKEILEENRIGEIWLGGNSISDGYWNIETSDRIVHNQYSYSNTGDLGFLKNNNLYVTGRSKDIIIKNGFNYYPQDIEQLVEQNHTFVRKGKCVAFSYRDEHQEKVLVVFEYNKKEKKLDFQNQIADIKKTVSEELGLQIDHILALKEDSIQKTTSGKKQRQLMKKLYKENQLDILKVLL